MRSPLLDYLFAFVGDMHYQMGMPTRCPELELKVEGVITLFFFFGFPWGVRASLRTSQLILLAMGAYRWPQGLITLIDSQLIPHNLKWFSTF